MMKAAAPPKPRRSRSSTSSSVRVVSANSATDIANATTRSAGLERRDEASPRRAERPDLKSTSVAPGYRNVLMSRIETSSSAGGREIGQIAANDTGPDDQGERTTRTTIGAVQPRTPNAISADVKRNDELGRRVEAAIRPLLCSGYEVGQPTRGAAAAAVGDYWSSESTPGRIAAGRCRGDASRALVVRAGRPAGIAQGSATTGSTG